MLARVVACGVLAAAMPAVVHAQPAPEGFLCCNMRTDGSCISDIDYAESGKRIVPLGTPAKVTGYGRYRTHVELAGNGRIKKITTDSQMRDLVVLED